MGDYDPLRNNATNVCQRIKQINPDEIIRYLRMYRTNLRQTELKYFRRRKKVNNSDCVRCFEVITAITLTEYQLYGSAQRLSVIVSKDAISVSLIRPIRPQNNFVALTTIILRITISYL